jgi:hypothetical protein
MELQSAPERRVTAATREVRVLEFPFLKPPVAKVFSLLLRSEYLVEAKES